MPFGGAVSGDLLCGGVGQGRVSGVTNAFRRSGQRGRKMDDDRFQNKWREGHQCLSAERSAGTPGLGQTLGMMTGHQCLSAERSAGTSIRKVGKSLPACRHQCLSAERSAGTLGNRLQRWAFHPSVTNAFRRSGQRGLLISLKTPKTSMSPMPFGGAVSGDKLWDIYYRMPIGVTNAFRRSGQRGHAIGSKSTCRQSCHQCLSAERSAGTTSRNS